MYGGECHHRANQHHALYPEVQHAGFLSYHFADGRIEQRRGRGDDGQQGGDKDFHQASRAARCAGTMR